MSDLGSTKLLSVVIVGRNDNYSGNFKYRLTTCVNYLARNIKEINRLQDVEILITDWNSEFPLSKVLALTSEAAEICRFVRVPPGIAARKQPSGQNFNTACAVNVSIRRAEGRFTMAVPSDVLFPFYSVKILFELLDGKTKIPFRLDSCLFVLPRKEIPWDVVHHEPSMEEWDRYLLLNGGELEYLKPLPGIGSGSSGFILRSLLWHECHGLDEQLSGWGWTDVESTLRICQRYPWMDLQSVGVEVFEMHHWKPFRDKPNTQVLMNPNIVSTSYEVNDSNWGLANTQLDVQPSENRVAAPAKEKKLQRISAEVISEMTGQELFNYLQSVFDGWRVSNSSEWVTCCILAWYSVYYSPRTYLEYGIATVYSALAVATASRGIEIYGIDSWTRSNGFPLKPPVYVSGYLRHKGFRGYLRLVTGDPCTALDRLNRTLIDAISFDLILLRGDLLGEQMVNHIKKVVLQLAPGGVLVFCCDSDKFFYESWKTTREFFPEMVCWTFESANVGVLFAAGAEGQSFPELSKEDQAMLLRSWKKFKPSLSMEWRGWLERTWYDFKRKLNFGEGRIEQADK